MRIIYVDDVNALSLMRIHTCICNVYEEGAYGRKIHAANRHQMYVDITCWHSSTVNELLSKCKCDSRLTTRKGRGNRYHLGQAHANESTVTSSMTSLVTNVGRGTKFRTNTYMSLRQSVWVAKRSSRPSPFYRNHVDQPTTSSCA
jgi:hypothetical protein